MNRKERITKAAFQARNALYMLSDDVRVSQRHNFWEVIHILDDIIQEGVVEGWAASVQIQNEWAGYKGDDE